MATIQANIPDSILRQAKAFAESENLSLEQVINLCLAHSLGTWTAKSIVEERGKRGSRKKFLEFMAKVPDIESDERDRLN
jgi:hypothetical protein